MIKVFENCANDTNHLSEIVGVDVIFGDLPFKLRPVFTFSHEYSLNRKFSSFLRTALHYFFNHLEGFSPDS